MDDPLVKFGIKGSSPSLAGVNAKRALAEAVGRAIGSGEARHVLETWWDDWIDERTIESDVDEAVLTSMKGAGPPYRLWEDARAAEALLTIAAAEGCWMALRDDERVETKTLDGKAFWAWRSIVSIAGVRTGPRRSPSPTAGR